MKFGMYSIYDMITEEYGAIMLYKNDVVARRSFKDICLNNKAIYKDLALYDIGVFDSENLKCPVIKFDPTVVSFGDTIVNESVSMLDEGGDENAKEI